MIYKKILNLQMCKHGVAGPYSGVASVQIGLRQLFLGSKS